MSKRKPFTCNPDPASDPIAALSQLTTCRVIRHKPTGKLLAQEGDNGEYHFTTKVNEAVLVGSKDVYPEDCLGACEDIWVEGYTQHEVYVDDLEVIELDVSVKFRKVITPKD